MFFSYLYLVCVFRSMCMYNYHPKNKKKKEKKITLDRSKNLFSFSHKNIFGSVVVDEVCDFFFYFLLFLRNFSYFIVLVFKSSEKVRS